MTTDHYDEHAFERLLAGLQTGDLFARVEAAEALGRLGDVRAFDPLIGALRDPEWRVSMAAVSALGVLGDTRAIHPIVETLHRDEVYQGGIGRAINIANVVIPALKELGEPGFQALLNVLREFAEDEFIGGAAASALGEMRDPRTLDTLLYARHSKVFEVGGEASAALSKLGEIAIAPLIVVLCEPLNEPPNEAYYHAQQALRSIGPATIPYLLDSLKTADSPQSRISLLSTLNFYEDERVLGLLKAALSDSDEDMRGVAAFALAYRGDPAALEQVLMTPQRTAGTNDSARALAHIGAPAVDPLILALSDPDRPEFARINAATALGEIGDMRAVEPLIAALRDEAPAIRLAAAQALGHLKHPRSGEALLTVLNDEIPQIRHSAIWSLGAIGDENAFDALARIATDSDEDIQTRGTAGLTLGRLDQERTIPIFREMLVDKGAARYLYPVLTSLGTKAIPPLLEAARSDNQTVRFAALRYLNQYLRGEHDPRIVELLVTLLHDGDPGIRHAAARMLGEIGDTRAVDTLVGALGHWSISERISAAQYLEKIGDARALPALEKALADGLNTGATYSNTVPGYEGMARDTFQHAILSIRARTREDMT
jgi:HEAT repeat protein